MILETVLKCVVHQVDEIGSVARFGLFTRHFDRSGDSAFVLLVSNKAILTHRLQDDIATLFGAIRMPERVSRERRLNHAGEHSRFGQRHLAQILAQIDLARFTEPLDAEAALVSQIDRVGVVLKNRFLGELPLQVQCDEGLRDLTAPPSFRAKPQSTGELLR